MPLPTRLAVLLVALVATVPGGCSAGTGAGSAASTTTSPPGGPPGADAVRTVVEHRLDGAAVVVEVVRVGADGAASMVVRGDDGEEVLVAEEVLVGTDHYVRLRDADAVLGADVWIHFDLTDPRQRDHLAADPVGLFDRADEARAGGEPGVRVRRQRIVHPPIERPPRDEVVALPRLDELILRGRPG